MGYYCNYMLPGFQLDTLHQHTKSHGILLCLSQSLKLCVSLTDRVVKSVSCSLLGCKCSTTDCDGLYNEGGVNFIFKRSCLSQGYLIITCGHKM